MKTYLKNSKWSSTNLCKVLTESDHISVNVDVLIQTLKISESDISVNHLLTGLLHNNHNDDITNYYLLEHQ